MVDKASEAMTAVERAQSSAFKFGNERTEAMLRLQKELLDMCNQASRDWLTRLKSETELWTGLATKLAEARGDVPPVGVLAIKPGAEEGTMTNFRADSFGQRYR